ncbi:MAG: HupE/UreJ family protein [Leptolyngbyaceae cyanobacterium]
MGSYFAALKCFKVKGLSRSAKFVFVAIATSFFTTLPALAHHPMGGKTPSSFIEGFLSGVGHPVIGLDHLIFVIASGLLAAAMGRTLMVRTAICRVYHLQCRRHLCVHIDYGIYLPRLNRQSHL